MRIIASAGLVLLSGEYEYVGAMISERILVEVDCGGSDDSGGSGNDSAVSGPFHEG